MRIHSLLLTAFIALLLIHSSCNTAEKENPVYSATIEEKIKQVENNLRGGVEISDNVNDYNQH
ncbi:MAG TPA: hypothetical protein VI461_17710 [Chitinophagaceae bacterium]|nr:hypothetical protein [Chitinophagaceae bacterium]